MTIAQKLKTWSENNLPLIFSILRNTIPILNLKDFALVTRFDDVQEVLSRPNVFGVTYAQKMGIVTGGDNFFLGMNDTATYTRDVSNMRLAVRRDDVESIIAPMITQFSNDIISNSSGTLDLVKDLAGIVPAQFVGEYMGIPGPSKTELIEWTTYMFQYLFFPNNPEDVDNKAIEYAAKTREYLDGLIASRKESKHESDDIISRCLELQKANVPGMSDVDIRNNLIGIIIGAVPTTSKSVALVMDYLFNNPKLLAKAQESANKGELEVIKQYVLESLRFNSFGAGVFRIANEDYTIAKGSFRSKKIKKGTTLLVATQSAMLDGRQVSSPINFKLDRPDYHYMHFGYGMHTCFGQYINLVQIPIIVSSILKCKNLRRADGEAGKIKFRGPFPESLTINFN